jgi:hypothetical protein
MAGEPGRCRCTICGRGVSSGVASGHVLDDHVGVTTGWVKSFVRIVNMFTTFAIMSPHSGSMSTNLVGARSESKRKSH